MFVKLCLSIVYFVLQGFDAYLLYKPDFGLISYSSGVELRSSERVVSTIVHDCPQNDRKMRLKIGHSYVEIGVHQQDPPQSSHINSKLSVRAAIPQ